MLEEDRAEVEPNGDEDPGAEEGGEAEEGGDGREVFSAAGADDGDTAKQATISTVFFANTKVEEEAYLETVLKLSMIAP